MVNINKQCDPNHTAPQKQSDWSPTVCQNVFLSQAVKGEEAQIAGLTILGTRI